MAIGTRTIRDLPKEQYAALLIWIEASCHALGWLDGYGLGRSYIDSRARGGKTYAARRRYVELDHKTAGLVPALQGIHWREIEVALSGQHAPAVPTK